LNPAREKGSPDPTSKIANKKQGWRGGSSGRAQRRMEIPL
jgi:hypothetical protein